MAWLVLDVVYFFVLIGRWCDCWLFGGWLYIICNSVVMMAFIYFGFPLCLFC